AVGRIREVAFQVIAGRFLAVGGPGADLGDEGGEWVGVGDDLVAGWRHAHEVDAAIAEGLVDGTEVGGSEDVEHVLSTEVGGEPVELGVDLLDSVGDERLCGRAEIVSVDVVESAAEDRLSGCEVTAEALEGGALVAGFAGSLLAEQLDLGGRLVRGVSPLDHGAAAVQLDERLPRVG